MIFQLNRQLLVSLISHGIYCYYVHSTRRKGAKGRSYYKGSMREVEVLNIMGDIDYGKLVVNPQNTCFNGPYVVVTFSKI